MYSGHIDDRYLYYVVLDNPIREDINWTYPKIIHNIKMRLDDLTNATIYSVFVKGYLNTFGITSNASFGMSGLFKEDYVLPKWEDKMWYSNRFEYLVDLNSNANNNVIRVIKLLMTDIIREIKINNLL